MSQLFNEIRRMTTDSRTISKKTDYPQYKISQLKTKLFLVENSQPEEVCSWWMRLIEGKASKEDTRQLAWMLAKL